MAFKKLTLFLLDRLASMGFEAPTELQEQLIPKVKSGADVFAVGAEGKGKTTGLIINVLQKLKVKAAGDNPRAIIFVKDRKAALELGAQFEGFLEGTDVRIEYAYEEQHIDRQKDAIYLGTDIVIGTPKRISKLYFVNGLNLMELQLLVVEDANFIKGTSLHTDIHRISEGVEKCQHLVLAESNGNEITKLRDLLSPNAQLIEVN